MKMYKVKIETASKKVYLNIEAANTTTVLKEVQKAVKEYVSPKEESAFTVSIIRI